MARWMRLAKPLPNAANAVYNAAAFAGATALAVTELLAESGGGRGGRKGGGEAATEAGLLPSRRLGGCALPTRCQTARTPCATARYTTARHATQRHATARDIASTSRVGRALGSLSKPGARDHKRAMFGEIRRKSRRCAARKNKRIHSAPHCVRRWASPQAHALLVAKAPSHQPSGFRKTSDQLREERVSGRNTETE